MAPVDPRNRKAFDWHVDASPVRNLSDAGLKDECRHWGKWLRQQHSAVQARRSGLRSKSARAAIRWGGVTASGLSLVALAATGIGVPVAIFGAGVTVFGEVYNLREDAANRALEPAISRVEDRLDELEQELGRRARR